MELVDQTAGASGLTDRATDQTDVASVTRGMGRVTGLMERVARLIGGEWPD